jgi:hypothetical protein
MRDPVGTYGAGFNSEPAGTRAVARERQELAASLLVRSETCEGSTPAIGRS